MPRLNIEFNGRNVGFLEYSDREARDAVTVLPGLNGVDTGVAFVAQSVRGGSALVFPVDEESIDLTYPTLHEWSEEDGNDTFQLSNAMRWSVQVVEREQDSQFDVSLFAYAVDPADSRWNFRLEIEDREQVLSTRVRGLGEDGYLEGRIRAEARSTRDLSMRFDAFADLDFGDGSIRISGMGREMVADIDMKLGPGPRPFPYRIDTQLRGDFDLESIKAMRVEAQGQPAAAFGWFILSAMSRLRDQGWNRPFFFAITRVAYSSHEGTSLTSSGLARALSNLSTEMLADIAGDLLGMERMATVEFTRELTANRLIHATESSEVGLGVILVHAHRRHPESRLYSEFFSDQFKTDSRLIQVFRQSQTANEVPEDERLPVLVEVAHSDWEPDFSGADIIGRVGNTVAMRASALQLRTLQSDSRVICIEASTAGADLECAKSVPLMNVPKVHDDYSEKGDQALVAIVDDGIDVLHRAFLDSSGAPRILAIWDQRDETGPNPDGFTFGTLHNEDAIKKYVKEQSVPNMLGRNLYSGHGTHVASIAAGRATGDFAGGVAPDAAIVVVLPRLDCDINDPQSVGYSISHGLALEFVRKFADYRGVPVVVNLSLGMNAGPHDGQSRLERDIETISDEGTKPGFVIVKSAGNDRDRKSHATVSTRTNSRETLKWISPYPKNHHARHKDVIEVWSKCVDDVEFRLVNPAGEQTAPVNFRSDQTDGDFKNGNRYEVTYKPVHPANGDSQLLITVHRGTAQHISPGTWELQIHTRRARRNAFFDAWIDKGDWQPVEFEDSHVSEERTLSIPGTARSVISVGSVLPDSTLQLGEYSAFGPTRDGREKPEVVAPGDGVVAAEAGTESGAVEMSGTSMAAPHVSGIIALLLSQAKKRNRIPSAKQVQSLLTQSIADGYQQWDRGMGYGLPDAIELLKRCGLEFPEVE